MEFVHFPYTPANKFVSWFSLEKDKPLLERQAGVGVALPVSPSSTGLGILYFSVK